jgi:signal transduction histidine kinase
VADRRHYQLQVNNIGILVETDPDLPRTMADPYQIQQVVLNLIVNAEHAIKGFRNHGQIVVRTETDGSQIRLTIEDDGPGIPENVRSKIFNPFFTTKEDGQGTGLGLSICLGIVQEHGGTIVAESLPHGGTAVIVELPVTDSNGATRSEALSIR